MLSKVFIYFVLIFSGEFAFAQAKDFYFDPKDNVEFALKSSFEYDLNDKENIKLGPVVFKKILTGAELFHLTEPDGITKRPFLFVSWPTKLIAEPVMTIIDNAGAVLFEEKLENEKLINWDDFFKSSKLSKPEIINSNTENAFFLKTLPKFFNNLPPQYRSTAKFCFSHSNNESLLTICSPAYLLLNIDYVKLKSKDFVEAVPKILFDGSPIEAAGEIEITSPVEHSFFAETDSGLTILSKFSSLKPEFREIVNEFGGEKIRIEGYGLAPWSIHENSKQNNSEIFNLTHFLDQTIGDFRNIWQISLHKAENVIYFPSTASGVFLKYYIALNSPIPNESDRLNLDRQVTKSTYRDNKLIQLLKPSQINLTEFGESGTETVKWSANTPEVMTNNIATIKTAVNNQNFAQSLEIYRGFPGEVSTRLTSIYNNKKFVLLGDLAFNYWFEDLFNMQSYYFSTLRWGISYKSFTSFESVQMNNNSSADESSKKNKTVIYSQNIDLKYRLKPGTWGREESWGLSINSHKFHLSSSNLNFFGLGVFWARSMPYFFDQLMNQFPFMKYPKFVDLDIIYFPISMNSNIKPESTYQINFHGKIYWHKNIFGEAGYGIKRYSYFRTNDNLSYSANIGYITLGLGLNF